jgi:hypothetical protein
VRKWNVSAPHISWSLNDADNRGLHGKEKLPERWITNLSGRASLDDDGRIFELLEEAKALWWT